MQISWAVMARRRLRYVILVIVMGGFSSMDGGCINTSRSAGR